MSKNKSSKLIEVLLKTIDRVGLNKTIHSLEITQISIDEVKLLQEHIIMATCDKFNISKKTLISGRKNIANRTNAIGVCSALLSRHCLLTQADIGRVLRKEVSNINKYIKRFDNLDENFSADRDILVKAGQIMGDIENIKNLTNKTENNG